MCILGRKKSPLSPRATGGVCRVQESMTLQCGLALARADKLPTHFDAQAKRIVLIVRLNYNS